MSLRYQFDAVLVSNFILNVKFSSSTQNSTYGDVSMGRIPYLFEVNLKSI